MFCSKCGKEIEQDMQFCIHCGSKVDLSSSTKKRNSKVKKSVKIALIIIISIILLSVIITIINMSNSTLKKDNDIIENKENEQQTKEDEEKEGLLNQSGNGGYVTGNTKVDVLDGSYYIPDGFKLAEDSGKTISEGIVVEDKNGNQWVWIPCYVDGGVGTSISGAIKYNRYDFKVQDGSYSDYSETLDKNDEISIKAFGGYYIGRYEAGYGKSTNSNAKKSGTSSNGNTNVVTIKKGQEPYVGVTQTQSVTLSKEIAETNNYDTSKMYTKLCSSYAWDTALKFIEKDYPTYPTNSTQGNHRDTIFTYTAINGESKKKDEKNLGSVPTGQTTAVKNIYDMGGNVWERTSEYCSDELYHCVSRGGGAYSYVTFDSAGDRGCISERSSNYDGFRITLYLNNSVNNESTETISKENSEKELVDDKDNYVGIGVYIKENTNYNKVEIISVIKDSPAEKAGIKSGDLILKVDEIEYTADDMDNISNKIKGQEGTMVTIEILRDTSILNFEITREKIDPSVLE